MPKIVEYYLSKGFDQKTAEYFAKDRRKVVDVAAHDDFTLTIRFDNGESRLYDVRPLIQKGTVFESFSNLADFHRVYVDAQHAIAWDIDPTIDSNKVWNNKVNICSDSCYLDSVQIENTSDVSSKPETLEAIDEIEDMIKTGKGEGFQGSTADFFAQLAEKDDIKD